MVQRAVAELPLHLSVLRKLRSGVEARRSAVLEQMGNGLPDSDYRIAVGRARECKVTIEAIDQLHKALMQGEFEDDDDTDNE